MHSPGTGAGRWLAGGTLVVAAAYKLTPFKDVCLAKCRSPLGFLMSTWRDGRWGAFTMGARHGAWCVGCCWALMASLFALGVMSLAWRRFVAALIALEETVPSGRAVVTYATAGLLLIVGAWLLAAPDSVLGLTIPRRRRRDGLHGPLEAAQRAAGFAPPVGASCLPLRPGAGS